MSATERRLGTFTHQGETLTLFAARYTDGHLAILARDAAGQPFGTLSVNLARVPVADDEFAVKTWSENAGWWQSAMMSGLFALTGRSVSLDYGNVAPIWQLVG